MITERLHPIFIPTVALLAMIPLSVKADDTRGLVSPGPNSPGPNSPGSVSTGPAFPTGLPDPVSFEYACTAEISQELPGPRSVPAADKVTFLATTREFILSTAKQGETPTRTFTTRDFFLARGVKDDLAKTPDQMALVPATDPRAINNPAQTDFEKGFHLRVGLRPTRVLDGGRIYVEGILLSLDARLEGAAGFGPLQDSWTVTQQNISDGQLPRSFYLGTAVRPKRSAAPDLTGLSYATVRVLCKLRQDPVAPAPK